MLSVYFFLFLSFLQIGLVGIGGPASLLAFVEHEVVSEHGWLTAAEFADMAAFCRVLPGNAPLSAATLSSYRALAAGFGFWAATGGALVAVFSLSVPAFAWSEIAERGLAKAHSKHVLDSMMALLRPLVPGLAAAAALLLMTPENFGDWKSNPWQFGVSAFLFLATLVGTGYYRFHPVFMLLLCGIAGWLLY